VTRGVKTPESRIRAAWADYWLRVDGEWAYTVAEVCERQGWQRSSRLYKHFDRLNLTERRGQAPDERNIRAAYRDYLLKDESGKWVYNIHQVAERQGWASTSSMYDLFKTLGLTGRRNSERCAVKPRKHATLPPCPGVNIYCPDCCLADELPKNCLGDWAKCPKCKAKSACPCWQPKSKEWTAAFKKWRADTERRKAARRRAEGHYARARQLATRRRDDYNLHHRDGDRCIICNEPVCNGKSLCLSHSSSVNRLMEWRNLNRKEAIELVRERWEKKQ